MTSIGLGHSAPTGLPNERPQQSDDEAGTQGLDEVVQIVFAAGLSLRVTADLSDQPAVVQRLEQIGSDLDAIVRNVWNANPRRDVPLGPSESTREVSALARGTRSKRAADPEYG